MNFTIKLNVVFSILLVAVTCAHAQRRRTVDLPNPFDAPHQRQPVRSVLTVSKNLLPPDLPIAVKTLNRYVGLEDEAGQVIGVQWSDLQPADKNGTVQATANYITDLPPRTNRRLKLFGPLKFPIPSPDISVQKDKEKKAVVVRTGRLGVKLAGAGSRSPPLLAVCRLPQQPDKGQRPSAESLSWHGRSTFANTGPVEKMTVESETGPVFYRQTNTYHFALGLIYRCRITCWAGLDYLTVEEEVQGPGSERMRWMFDLEDWPTHVYTAGHGATQKLVYRRHSSAYLDFPLAELDRDKEFLWLPNYLIWSRMEEALLANFVRSATGPDGQPPFEDDMLTVFQIRRGEWEDKMWAGRSRRPLGDAPWRPWSQRRWWGSRFGTIRVARNGHEKSGALLKFSLAPGTRSWGLAVGDSATLPPARKMVFKVPLPSYIKTAAGEVRLTEIQRFRLNWAVDPRVEHPRMELTSAMLRTMQQKAKTDPYFANELQNLQKNDALQAVIQKDRKAANAIARRILGDMNTRFNFPLNDGFEFTSHLTPVGIRPVYQYATKIDLLLGEKDLLEPEIRQQLRERFAFLAYLLADSSFMAHKYNAGHPNFDADRYVTLAGIAMLYPDHPHSQQWLDSAVSSLREAMRIYVIPKSGKWAENLGGYYNWSTNIIGGMANALKHTGAADPYAWPEFQDFWRWGLITALPPKPPIGNLGGDRAVDRLVRVRQTAGIGDNGGDGGLGVHGGFALAGAHMLDHNPELGRQLLWLWDQGGRAGYGHYPYALFFGLTPEHLRVARDPRSAPKFQSRVLQGYGSIFRSEFGRPSESYLLFKCGPGGYRYHGEEGSFVLFGQGQPLCLDGGRNFRPEHHSTVTLGKENAGLLRGRIVQFESTPQLDYAAGRFPGTPEQLRRMGLQETRPEPTEQRDNDQTGLETRPTRLLHEEGDVMSRQILFRKNDYVVIRDRIDSGQDATWRLLLLAEELKNSKHRLDGKGWLGENIAVSLFQFTSESETLKPVPAQRIVVDSQPLKQQRIALPLPPGHGVVAVIDFFKSGQQPWRVKSDRGQLVLDSPKGNVTEIVKLSGDTVPLAQWRQLQGTRETASWTSSQFNDPWQIATRVSSPGAAVASSDHELITIAGRAASPQQAKADLLRYKNGVAALHSAGLFTMMTLERHVGVVEPDGSGGLRTREIRDAKTPLAMTGRIEQARRNKLPPQIALIRTGDSARHHMVSLLARRSLSQWSGYAVHEITVQGVLAGKLKEFTAAALFQASASDINDESRTHIQKFVAGGGTLICDMPSLPGEDGTGTTAAWSKFVGFSYGKSNPRGRFAFTDANRGYIELRSAEAEFLKQTGGGDLGHWYLKPAKAARLVRDKSGRTTVVTHSAGRGSVITLCFRFTSVAPDTNNQIYLAKLLRPFFAESHLHPLVDAPWAEKTILPQDDKGLMIGLHNPRRETIHSTLRFPHHKSPRLTPIYVPFGGVIDTDHIVLPPRSWIVFGVK